MTSRSSFWGSLIENNKRRIWVWTLSALCFLLALPTYVAFSINRQLSSMEYYIRESGTELGAQIIKNNVFKAVEYCLTSSDIQMVMVAGLAFLIGVQGFSWLYSRKKIDFYMGMPVKRKKRFLVIWLNGIFIFLLPYVLGVIISLLISATYDVVTPTLIGSVMIAMGRNLLLYLGVYHMAILAVMLTGNIVITVFAFGVFCLYEFVVRSVFYTYQQMFFSYFSYHSMETEPVVSPFTLYYSLLEAQEKGVGWGGYLVGMLLFAGAAYVLAYICYLKRPAESAGKAMVFSVTKPVVKILIMVPLALLVGYFMAEAVNYRPSESGEGVGFVIFTIAASVIIGCALMQVIYEFDIKGAFHKKSHIVITGVGVALIFMVFRYDFFDYDAYVPDAADVESIAFIPFNYETAAGYYSHVDEWGDYMSEWEYAKQNMFLKDKEAVEAVCELAEISMEEYEEVLQYAETMDLSEDELYTGEETESKYHWSTTTVIYRLKNGREVSREFKVNVKNEEASELLDCIIGQPEFKTGYFDGASERLVTLLRDNDKYAVEVFYGNTIYSNRMSRQEAAEFVELYQEEIMNADFTALRDNVPTGVLLIDVTETNLNGVKWTRTIGVNVYEFMENSVAYLREKGYYLEEYLSFEDVERIQIINHNQEARLKLQELQNMQVGAAEPEEVTASVRVTLDSAYYIDTSVYVDYTEPEQIAAIIEMLYPNELIGYDWDGAREGDDDYEVNVYFKNGSVKSKNLAIVAYCNFLEGQVPEFVREDTAYKE